MQQAGRAGELRLRPRGSRASRSESNRAASIQSYPRRLKSPCTPEFFALHGFVNLPPWFTEPLSGGAGGLAM